MKILVTLKWIPNPELPTSFFESCDGQARVADNVGRVVGPFDKAALELALKLRDQDLSAEIICMTMGPSSSDEALRFAMGYGIEQVFRIDAPDLGPDSMLTGQMLTMAIEALEEPPAIIILGEQSGDWDQGIVGSIIAEKLQIPYLSRVVEMKSINNAVVVRQLAQNNEVTLKAERPVLITATLHPNTVLRFPSLKNVIVAKRRIPQVLPLEVPRSTIHILKLTHIPPAPVSVEWVQGSVDQQLAVVKNKLMQWGIRIP